MTTAISVAVADAIADELRHHTFTLAPTTHRTYIQDKNLVLQDVSDLRIDVQVGEKKTDSASRETIIHFCETNIAVRKKFSDEESDSATGYIDTAEIDRLLLFVEELHDYFAKDADALSGRRLTSYDDAIYEGIEFFSHYAPDHLREERQFTSVLIVKFKVYA